jgi:serine/threonine protein kinase
MDGDPQLTSGDTIVDYTVESLIGCGGMGEVFRAADLRLARAVALKVLAPALADDPGSRARILRESQVAASIDHPNVIPIHSAGEADGHVYIAMRLVEGSDLRAELRREGRLQPARAIRLETAPSTTVPCQVVRTPAPTGWSCIDRMPRPPAKAPVPPVIGCVQ